MIVLDASAAVELVLATPPGAAVARRLRDETVHAPAHIDVEVIGAIRRAVVRRLIGDHEGVVAVADFLSLQIRRWPIKPFAQRAYQLRTTHIVADAVYVALAEGFGVRLITCDGRLAQSHGHDAEIELVA
ncbi:VapC toxin family PIN domain ribonuclease [Mycobacterium kansasii]|uniref:type II toxin-antitoxin system VapC family toxin n=1 Tax=Mycobacterium kansasii TaxID=1768 RepID=UPI000CDD106D|nr:type II toxin-antitoxin system VapC family toxin [Mycobacterium kansasii]POX84271.1 VapC toxin family PIN domain ribonuclease [Mycobacterium kansasii]POX98848.1 VapC toxin family PIN domain ribonuclease [Mycobacterium kansasii]POY09026.1 VapC toxin family PIN domain ribonuclease [Mycobacterium kansasii]POY15246.1 VapC toxin family PIN domain ribonuclease [Mycobacterium kansasii]POY18880.1 VapC toxin family PIN domain ribonuclease [Mycobacterium kansasii]